MSAAFPIVIPAGISAGLSTAPSTALSTAPSTALSTRRPAAAAAVRDAAGHTLAELLIVLGLAAVVAAFATPTFRELGANVRRDALVEELRASLLLARAEAIARGVPVVVCPSADGRACRTEPAWSRGWLVRARQAGPDPGAPVLSGVRNDAPLYVHGTRVAVEFQPTASAATTATFTVCDWRGSSAARAVIVSRTGRVRVARGAEARCG
jgi:type IV fimbrial biogenesis protein FimT